MEILAPAGSKESFIAAVEAGADAVYCGLGSFSARSKAENFTPAEFNNYTRYAHSKNVKVYAAFNTLIKQRELKEVVKLISCIEAAGADAVIVQDLGIVNIVKNHFPSLNLHASTQLTVHNSYGALEAAKAGFKRAVLARELSLSEIKEISKKSAVELEVFCHGALCFGVSGICLMSSFIGGFSGNRGLCAQPCRRKWKVKNKEGFYLSPNDLELAQYVPELKKAGICSLKIEGRMKNPQYVYKTVKAYKMLVQADQKNFEQALREAREMLSEDLARSKTSFNFAGKYDDVFSPESPKQTGISLGKVLSSDNGVITLETGFEINEGDTLKAADASKDSYFKFKISGVSRSGNTYTISTDASFLKTGTEIFKTSDGGFASFLQNTAKKVEIEKLRFNVKPKEIKVPSFKPAASTEEKLFIRIDDAQWLKIIRPGSAGIVFCLRKDLWKP